MCERCKGTGWVVTTKPVLSPIDGEFHMIGIPQICFRCDSYESNQRGHTIVHADIGFGSDSGER